MAGKMVEFRANGHTASGWLATPAQGTGPGVLVIQEYWGLVDHIKQVTERFAAEGFVALAPDLYHGESAKSPDEAGRKMMALNIGESAKELRGAADYLLALPELAPKKIAAVGFCMGGQLALMGACDHPDRILSAVDFYGIHPAVRLQLDRIAGAVQCHFAEHDEYIPTASAKQLVEQIAAAGVQVESHFYGAGHAFFNDARPEAYHAASANQAWTRTLAFLRAQLA